MKITNPGNVKNSFVSRSRMLVWLAVLSVSIMMVGSAHAGCVTGVVDETDPNFTITILSMSPAHVYASVTTTCTGSGCTNPPTLTGGSIHLDLCLNGRKYSGDGNLVAGAAARTQVVNVSVPITPKVSGTYTVVRSVIAYFSDGTEAHYTHTCPSSLLAAGTKKVVVGVKPAAKK